MILGRGSGVLKGTGNRKLGVLKEAGKKKRKSVRSNEGDGLIL